MRLFIFVFAFLFLGITESTQAQERVINMPEAPSKTHNLAESDKNSFWFSLEICGGTTAMENRKNVAMLDLSYIGGFRLNQYLKCGLGLGVLYYPNSEKVRDIKKHLGLPIFANVRGNFITDEMHRIVPYWSLNIGSSIPDGFLLSPAVGLRVGEKRNAFIISLGYTLRHLKVYAGEKNMYSGVLFNIGYEY